MKTLGIITLYYPPKDVLTNIASFIDGIDGLIVWDNTPNGSKLNLPEAEREKDKISKLKALSLGVIHGLSGRLDKDTYFKKMNR